MAGGGTRIPAPGEWRRLDPRYIPFQRYASLIAAASLSLALLVGAATIWLAAEDAPRWIIALLLPAWFLVAGLLAWGAFAWPPLDYRYTAYMLDEHGIEIRTGVVWRAVMNLPRSRVQHIEVSQGPLERAYGLGRLVIYTAGTEHSRVELPGLEHGVALALRDHLLPKGQDDAV
ncbi:MAG TPA: PH domain-containing protein [Vicinamibacterales bacterium]|nr:PH domain-containing protein [Vicinamibacterales bacterium]